TVTYSKVGGPSWLTVEADGRVSGVPGINDSGNSPFRVRATASGVLCTDFELRIPVTAPADLRAHYELNGALTDTAASYHGSGQGGGPTYLSGWFDKAADLDGTDDYVQLPAGFLNGVTDCTFAARFRWDGGNSWQRVFDFGNNTTQYIVLTPNSAAGTLRFTISTTGNASEQILETPMPAPGDWTTVAIVLSGDTGTLYVNGAVASTGTITLDPANIAPVLNYLGKSQWPDPYFNGAIDDLRIYNRALNATEVRSLAVPPAATIVPRSGYSAWKAGFTFPVGQSQPEADPDQDGQANLIEWLLGTDPLVLGPDSGKTLAAQRLTAEQVGLTGDKTYLGLAARIRKDRPATTLIPEAAATPDGLAAAQAATQVLQAGPPVDDGDFEIITWYYTVPIEDGATGFIRLRVIQN
uniref:LamG domain-containing protein n=1 Tax=Haloferula sp. BvORR071 TaxID=1396141 RepID=UPI0005509EB8